MKLLSVKEVAELIGVQPSTIYQWTHQRFIPHIKVGKLVRFNADDISRWLGDLKNKGRKSRKYDIRELNL